MADLFRAGNTYAPTSGTQPVTKKPVLEDAGPGITNNAMQGLTRQQPRLMGAAVGGSPQFGTPGTGLATTNSNNTTTNTLFDSYGKPIGSSNQSSSTQPIVQSPFQSPTDPGVTQGAYEGQAATNQKQKFETEQAAAQRQAQTAQQQQQQTFQQQQSQDEQAFANQTAQQQHGFNTESTAQQGQIQSDLQQKQALAALEQLRLQGTQTAGLSAQQAQQAREYLGQQGTQTSGLSAQEAQQARGYLGQQGEQQLGQMNRAGEIETGRMGTSAKLQSDAETRRMDQLPQILQSLGMGGGGPGPLNTAADPNGPSQGAPIDANGMGAQEQAARAAAFSRAKDQRGQIASQSIQGLQNAMAGRGLQGSTIEAGHAGDIIGEAGGGLEDFSNEQAILDVNRAGSIADRNYAGDLTKRGQNMSLAPSLLGLIGQRALY